MEIKSLRLSLRMLLLIKTCAKNSKESPSIFSSNTLLQQLSRFQQLPHHFQLTLSNKSVVILFTFNLSIWIDDITGNRTISLYGFKSSPNLHRDLPLAYLFTRHSCYYSATTLFQQFHFSSFN